MKREINAERRANSIDTRNEVYLRNHLYAPEKCELLIG